MTYLAKIVMFYVSPNCYAYNNQTCLNKSLNVVVIKGNQLYET